MSITATRLYTVRDLAERFDRSDQVVRRWARKGLLPSIQPEGVYLFTEDHVQAFLTGTVKPPAPVEAKPLRNPRKYPHGK